MAASSELRAAEAQRDAVGRALRRRVEADVLGYIDSVGPDGWYDPQRVERVAREAARSVEVGQALTARETDLWLRKVSRIALNKRPRASPTIDPSTLRGVPHQVVYERLGAEYRRLISEGVAESDAIERVRRRGRTIAGDDLGLAMRHQTAKWAGENKMWYRRILRPELSAGIVCGLCVAASDRIYKRGDLMPIHSGCRCDVMPATTSRDPGRDVNAEDLDRLYAQGGTDYVSLRKTRVAVREHGELGPVLTHEDHNFRGPQQAAADRR